MFADIENIKLISSSFKERKKRSVKNRRGHVINFRTSGFAIFKFDKKTIESPTGSILFIPDGSSYDFDTIGDEPCISASVTFFADIKNPEPMVFNDASFLNLSNLFVNIYKQFHSHTPYSKNMCLSLLYSIFANITKQESITYCEKRKHIMIESALNYIDEHFLDANLKTDMLHTLCNISPAYFRRIFKANTGSTPQKYIEEKRLKHAFRLINESEHPISKIAEMVGYNDPLYFGSVFKKKYGVPPSHMRQSIQQ